MFCRRSPIGLHVISPAKINLFLELLAKRPDGFHELETLMLAVSLYDQLLFVPTTSPEIQVFCDWAPGLLQKLPSAVAAKNALGELPAMEKNLITRTLVQLKERSGFSGGAKVWVRKSIPAAAGLGGASSNSAAVLLAANDQWHLNWSIDQLSEIAANLGSDIGFFLHTGQFGSGLAVCRGRGEKIEPLSATRKLDLVIIKPFAGLSTADVFKQATLAKSPKSSKALVNAMTRGSLQQISSGLINRLQQPARNISPTIDQISDTLNKMEVVASQMSGSGTSFFAICRNHRHASRTAQQLRAKSLGTVFKCKAWGSILERLAAIMQRE